jgi:amino-acid N-acetyltransferase
VLSKKSRGLRQRPLPEHEDVLDADVSANVSHNSKTLIGIFRELKFSLQDFILSILHASPSFRDTTGYRKSFGLGPHPAVPPTLPPTVPSLLDPQVQLPSVMTDVPLAPTIDANQPSIVSSILNPINYHTALVKFQGPFSPRQLESIARGMVHLSKLGLVSVIVIESDDWVPGEEGERRDAVEECMTVAKALEEQGARARPVLDAIVRLGPHPNANDEAYGEVLEAHALPQDLVSLRSALRAGEIPVLPSLARDSFCRSVRISSNDVIAALAKGMVDAASSDPSEFDLTPLRLMIINREGGIPSYARSGLPHLLINVNSEYDHINTTYDRRWTDTHPTALSNMKLARTCLSYMPRTSSAIIVSHRSPRSLIANLITNKPAQSSSLPHALLSGPKAVTPHTPTLIRHGLPIRVIRSSKDIDKEKMTFLLEESFDQHLGVDEFYERLDRDLDFAIIAGDYAGAAIVTKEGGDPMAYLDKFAVLPQHQGDGTVDFLWVALHDETYGLGLQSALNPNVGGRQGRGTGRDLVWRSRANNPVNKWYFERSTGHVRLGKWVMFWCDAEHRLAEKEKGYKESEDAVWVGKTVGRGVKGLKFVEEDERGRLDRWGKIVEKVPGSWV